MKPAANLGAAIADAIDKPVEAEQPAEPVCITEPGTSTAARNFAAKYATARAVTEPGETVEVDRKELAANRAEIARAIEHQTGRAIDDPMSIDEAQAITTQIKEGIERVWKLVEQAYLGRAWEALQYESWDAYCLGEFGDTRLQLPREERTEMVRSLRHAGLSTRAIASAAGVSAMTVRRDLDEVGQNVPPDAEQVETVDAELVEPRTAVDRALGPEPAPPPPETVIGLDKKRHPARRAIGQKKPKPKPQPKPVPHALRGWTLSLDSMRGPKVRLYVRYSDGVDTVDAGDELPDLLTPEIASPIAELLRVVAQPQIAQIADRLERRANDPHGRPG